MTTTYYELTSGAIVEVTRIEGRVAHLADGGQAWLKDLSRPDWLVDAEREAADFADEHNTIESVRRG